MSRISRRNIFSLERQKKSFSFAFRGIILFLKTQPNAWIQIIGAGIAFVLGYICTISSTEWALMVLAIVLVFSLEAINTAIEFDIDLTSPETHILARNTKDVAAGAVFIASLGSILIGAIIFIPKLILLFSN